MAFRQKVRRRYGLHHGLNDTKRQALRSRESRATGPFLKYSQKCLEGIPRRRKKKKKTILRSCDGKIENRFVNCVQKFNSLHLTSDRTFQNY